MTAANAARITANLEAVSRTLAEFGRSRDPEIVSRVRLARHSLNDAIETVRRWAREEGVTQ